METNSVERKDDPNSKKDSMIILEEALIICGFGKFHYRLLAATLCASFASMIAITTSSYILPVAECDLKMNIMQKGILIAMPFCGQVGAALLSGFLLDVFGRKVFLVGSNASLFIFTIIEGSSQAYWMLLLMKLCQGISLSFCWGAVSPMLTEFVNKNVRDRVLLMNSSFISMSLIVAALVSWAILPLQIHIVVWKGYFELHAWNIYIYANSIWSFIATLLYYYLPESPKFLLSHGQEKEALDVLKAIYVENSGNNGITFPILSLRRGETINSSEKSSIKRQLINALFEVKTLFRAPLVYRLFLFTLMSTVCMLTYTPIRLWYPQVSTFIESYRNEHTNPAQFCVMINTHRRDLNIVSVSTNTSQIEICIPQVGGSETYTNGVLMGFIFLVLICISSCAVDYLGQKVLMFIALITCAVCSGSLYWTYSSIQVALLLSTTCAVMQTFLSIQHTLLLRTFPTTLRALTVSFILMTGRVGSLLGNILFPVLLEMGCMAPFLFLSIVTICVATLVFFLPDRNNGNSESDN